MMKTRTLALASVAAIALMLTGCAAGPNGSSSTDGTSNSSTSPDGSGQSDGSGVATEKCGGLTTEALEKVFGKTLEGPESERGHNDKNGVKWTDSGCDWASASEKFEVDFDVAVASDFPDGTVGCAEPGGIGDIVSVKGIGTQAWWEFSDLNEAEGTLTVCTADALLELEIDAESGAYTGDELRDLMLQAVRPLVEA